MSTDSMPRTDAADPRFSGLPGRPGKIIAVHLSYVSRADQRGRRPTAPSYFFKASSSVAASESPIERPGGTELLAFEGEIALVIGTAARRVGLADAWRHVGWVTAANDFGLYDLRANDKGSNVRSKGGDGYTPIGPALIDARAVDPAAIRVRTWVNGALAQDDTTAGLLFPLAQFVADLSQHFTLEPGDVILTGTPAGSSVVVPGDVVEVEVDAPTAPGAPTSGRLVTPVTQGDGRYDATLGSLPAVDDTQRAEAWGSVEAARPGIPAPGIPAPGIPAPGIPAPGIPAPAGHGIPAPGDSPRTRTGEITETGESAPNRPASEISPVLGTGDGSADGRDDATADGREDGTADGRDDATADGRDDGTAQAPTLSPDLRAKLERVPVAALSGQLRKRGLNNVTIDGVRPLHPDAKLVGTAKTLRFVPNREDLFASHGGGYNAQKRAFDAVRAGEVLVIEARGEAGAGTLGDVLAIRAHARHAAGIVTDGAVRDHDAVVAVGIPVYTRGAHPAVLGRRHVPWDADLTIACGGVTVQPGDVIVGDADGVIVIPPALAEEVADAALAQEDQDAWIAARVAEGHPVEGLFPMNAAWRARYDAERGTS